MILLVPGLFLSTPSVRRATVGLFHLLGHPPISIHALREEGDSDREKKIYAGVLISIHALREEGDGT